MTRDEGRGAKAQMKLYQKGMVGGTAVLLALVLAVRLFYLPAVGLIRDRRAALQDLRVKRADSALLEAALVEQEAALQRARQRRDLLDLRLNQQTVARVLEELGAQARQRRLELTMVQSQAEGEQPVRMEGAELKLRRVPLTLKLKGSYRDVGAFLGWLARAPFLAVVGELKMEKPWAGDPNVQAELVLSVCLA